MVNESKVKERMIEILRDKNSSEFKRYVEEHEIHLKNLNNNNFDILIHAIEENVSIELLVWIIIHSKYKTLNYTVEEKNNNNKGKKTPLSTALEHKIFKIADFLIEYGADINYIPYSCFKQILNDKVSKYILSKDSVILADSLVNNLIKENKSTKNNFLKLYFSKYVFEDNFILKILSLYKNKVATDTAQLNQMISKEKNKMVPFFVYAITVQNKTVVEYFYHHGIDINSIKVDVSIKFAKNIIELKKVELLPILTHNNFNMNQKDEYGNTLLNHAVSHGNKKIIKYLIDDGANVNGIGSKGLTPLTLALLEVSMRENSDKSIVKFLVEDCGADIEKIDGTGYSPLTSAIRYFNKDMVKYLIHQGANIDKLDGNKESPLSLAYDNERENNMLEDPTFCGILDYLIDCGANIQGNRYQNLVYAVKKGDTAMVKDLVENGQLEDQLTEKDFYSFFVMAIRNHRMEMVKTMNALWEYNIEYWERVYNKSTSFYEKAPLFLAIRYSHLGMVKCIMECGAKVIMDDRYEYSHLHYVLRCGEVEKLKYLLNQWGTKNPKGGLECFSGNAFHVNKQYNFMKGELYYKIHDVLNTYVEKNSIDLLHNYENYNNNFYS